MYLSQREVEQEAAGPWQIPIPGSTHWTRWFHCLRSLRQSQLMRSTCRSWRSLMLNRVCAGVSP